MTKQSLTTQDRPPQRVWAAPAFGVLASVAVITLAVLRHEVWWLLAGLALALCAVGLGLHTMFARRRREQVLPRLQAERARFLALPRQGY
ncbi:MAG: hypothetical protein QOF58_1938 [Pseudonocardiales bacterium]|nr:hypothetical protein [Pseudonocardiales bacterium]